MMIRFAIILLLAAFAVQAEETKEKKPSTKVEYSFTEGTVDGKPLRVESSRTGATTLSTGSLGGKPVDTLTVRLDIGTVTVGTVGDESVEIITIAPDKR